MCPFGYGCMYFTSVKVVDITKKRACLLMIEESLILRILQSSNPIIKSNPLYAIGKTDACWTMWQGFLDKTYLISIYINFNEVIGVLR